MKVFNMNSNNNQKQEYVWYLYLHIFEKWPRIDLEEIKLKFDRSNIYERKNLTFEHKSDELEWRRSKVVEMRARGMTH